MKLCFSWLKSRRKVITVCTIVIVLFAASYLLFDMPAIVVLYPLSVSLLVCIVAAILDYVSFCARHKTLEGNELPDPADLIEADYQKRIADLEETMKRAAAEVAEDYTNRIDYYTVWAHQIKTPIAAMRLSLQSEDTESSRKLTADLNRIEAYVEMVLTFLRLDSDSTDYVIREYDLDSILRAAVRKFSREFILKKLSLDYEPVKYTVLTDEKWLSFVVEQIISNAVKYTSEGGIRICMPEPGILRIEDTGVGICAEDLPRIFENGYTGFNGREDKRASGIGLYLCKRITENLGHGISAESQQGEGTTILLDLRRKQLGVDE